MARAQGIDTRTYLDTEDTDWKSEVTIPVLLTRIKLHEWVFRFSPVVGLSPHEWGVPTNTVPALIETFAPDGVPLGPIITLLGKRWNHEECFHEPGEYKVLLADHVLMNVGDNPCHSRLEAVIKVAASIWVRFPSRWQAFGTSRKVLCQQQSSADLPCLGEVPRSVSALGTSSIAISPTLR